MSSYKEKWNLEVTLRFAFSHFREKKVKVLVPQSHPTVCDLMDCRLPGSSLHGIFQGRILEWVDISFFRGSSQPRDQTWVPCIRDRFFIISATNYGTNDPVQGYRQNTCNSVFNSMRNKMSIFITKKLIHIILPSLVCELNDYYNPHAYGSFTWVAQAMRKFY